MNGKFLSKHQHLFLTIGSFLAVYLVYLLYAYVLCPFEPVRPNRIVMKETPSSKREEIAGYLLNAMPLFIRGLYETEQEESK